MLGKQLIQAASGSAAAGDALYVDDVFSTYLAVGAGGQTITNGIDLATEGGMVWSKARAVGAGYGLHDTERGVNKFLSTNSNNPQIDVSGNTSFHTLSSFNTDGFTTGNDGGYGVIDLNGYGNYVHWSFRKAPGFFDVCQWVGNSVSGRQIAHNLGSVPGFIIVKSYVPGTGGTGWMCYHRSLGNTKSIRLDQSNAVLGPTAAYWNNTDPTSTHFTVGNNEDINSNAAGRSYVAYVFAHDDQSFGTDGNESIIKCGSFAGNGSTTAGPIINLGFEPQWLMVKRVDSNESSLSAYHSWVIQDSMRGLNAPPYTSASGYNNLLFANLSVAEGKRGNGTGTPSTQTQFLITPTGFTVQSGATEFNRNNGTYIYMAIRRPHKPPEAATEVFKPTLLANGVTSIGFVPDLNIAKWPSGSQSWFWTDRLRGGAQNLNSDLTNVEALGYTIAYDKATNSISGGTYGGLHANYTFKRAPGFMDVVAYSGNGSQDRQINHALGSSAPGMVIVKSRTNTQNWAVWHEGGDFDSSEHRHGFLNHTYDFNNYGYFNNAVNQSTYFTKSIFTVRTVINTNGQNYIAYLFATLSGVSKVGSFTGTGNAINVDCGFSAGARFILIKRADSTGDWYVYDTARGIVSGNDPYIFINTNSQEVTNTDYIDPLSSGFTVTSSAPTGLNASGGTYIFLAIA